MKDPDVWSSGLIARQQNQFPTKYENYAKNLTTTINRDIQISKSYQCFKAVMDEQIKWDVFLSECETLVQTYAKACCFSSATSAALSTAKATPSFQKNHDFLFLQMKITFWSLLLELIVYHSVVSELRPRWSQVSEFLECFRASN